MRLLAALVCALALSAFALEVFGVSGEADFGAALTRDGHVFAVSPGGPAQRAGLRAGDLVRFDRMPLLDRVDVQRPVAGKPVTVVVERGAHVTQVPVTPARLPVWNTFYVFAWILALLYAGMALLVSFRAPPGRQRTVIVTILTSLTIAWAVNELKIIPLASIHLATRIITDLCVAVFLIAAYLFVLWYPPRRTAASVWLWRIGLPVSAASALYYAYANVAVLLRVAPAGVGVVGDILTIAASVAMIAGVTDGVAAAPRELRTQTIVAGSTLVTLALVNVAFASMNAILYDAPWQMYLGLLQWASGFGVTYAVLRHRLLDLNLVISRAAIFSVVSILLLGLFALAEWVFATVLEHALGPAFNEGGKTALAACVALLLGLSAGSVHQSVEHRLNRVFFARRYKALEDLHRFALETDAATDSSALLELTLNTLRRDLDVQYVALYTGRPESGYVAAGTSAAPEVPLRFDQNEEVVLRLRRWGEPFVIDNNPAHPLVHAYVAPMMLRGTLYGFAICGPKIDRTSYWPDERDAVAQLVHRVGIAYEWLTRAVTPPVDPRTVRP